MLTSIASAFLLAVTAYAAEISAVESYDVNCVNPFLCHHLLLTHHTLTKRQFKNASSLPTFTTITADGKISYTIECEQPTNSIYPFPEDFCPKVVQAFKESGEYLTQFLDIKKAITVHAKVHSFCNNGQTARPEIGSKDCKMWLGNGRPASFYRLKGEDVPNTLYPQSLARQVITADDFRPYDIEMEFNTDTPFFFRDSVLRSAKARTSSKPISSEQYDFLHVAIHEQIHGLGMVTLWNTNIQTLPDDVRAALPPGFSTSRALAPPVVEVNGGQVVLGGIYDYYLVSVDSNGNRVRWNDTIARISALADPSSSIDDKLVALRLAGGIYQTAITPTSVRFNYPEALFNAGTPLTQFSDIEMFVDSKFQNYLAGSSIVHVDRAYQTTEDFLMTPSVTAGVSVDQMMDKNDGRFEPLGKRSFGVLVSMGYAPKQKYLDLLRTELESSATSLVPATWLLGVFAALMLI